MTLVFRKSAVKRYVSVSFALAFASGVMLTDNISAQIPAAQSTIGTAAQFNTTQVNWQNNFNTAAVSAKSQQKLLLIHFYGNNCPPCRAMDAEVYTNPVVISKLNQLFVPVKIDTAEYPELVKQYSIKAIPTNLVIDETGRVIDKRQGGINAEKFNQYLDYLQTISGKAMPQIASPQPAAGSPPVQTMQAVQVQQVAPLNNNNNAVQYPAAAPATAPMVLNDPFLQQPAAQQVQPVQIAPITATPAPAVSTVVPAQPAVQPVEIAKSLNPMRAAEPVPVIGGLTPPAQTVIPPVPNTAAAVPAQSAVVLPENLETVKMSMVELPLALDGYCPVVLTNEERWTQGNPQFYAMFQGLVYHFSSEKAVQTFIENPLKYAPASKGEDIVLLAERNKKSFGSRKFGAWFDGKVYLFSCQETLNMFAAKPEHYAAAAKQQETAQNTSPNTVQR